MKKILLVFLASLIFAQAQALTGADSDKQLLFQILKERQDHFSAYTKSLDEATGIFGFKTKKDIQRSNAILIDIVKLDNRMIAVLNRELSYKDYEKTSMNYNNLDDQKDLDLLRQNLALSDAKIKELSAKLLDDQQQINNRNRAIVVLSLGLLFLLYRRQQAKKAV
jgi:hypothetical protein